jgi:hypothetical protein
MSAMAADSEGFSYGLWLDHSGWFEVPAEQTERFEGLLRALDAIYREHAIHWSVRRSRTEPERWFEDMPRFREEADARAAADALTGQVGLLEGLDEFRLPPEDGIWMFEGSEWQTVHDLDSHVGDWSSFELPTMPPGERTAAMKRAHRLAPAIATRIDGILPEGWSAHASNEFVVAGG